MDLLIDRLLFRLCHISTRWESYRPKMFFFFFKLIPKMKQVIKRNKPKEKNASYVED